MLRMSSTCRPISTACIFWLKNRDPDHWRDGQQLEHVLGKYIISDKPMCEEAWEKARADVIDANDTPTLPEPSDSVEKPNEINKKK